MRFGSFVVDYGEFMAPSNEPLAVGERLLHGLAAPAM
jgi:hypothetical protein